MTSQPPPIVFILPKQPRKTDKRKRNAFGYLVGFGEAYAAYYRRMDKPKPLWTDGVKEFFKGQQVAWVTHFQGVPKTHTGIIVKTSPEGGNLIIRCNDGYDYWIDPTKL